jgi:hypothetical protein
MKTQLILTALLSLCLFALDASAGLANLPLPDENKLIVRSDAIADQGMEVHLANLQQRYTQVKLTTIDGRRILSTKSINNHNGYRFAFDLSSLNDGRYLLQVEQGKTTLTQVVLISAGIIRFSAVK